MKYRDKKNIIKVIYIFFFAANSLFASGINNSVTIIDGEFLNKKARIDRCFTSKQFIDHIKNNSKLPEVNIFLKECIRYGFENSNSFSAQYELYCTLFPEFLPEKSDNINLKYYIQQEDISKLSLDEKQIHVLLCPFWSEDYFYKLIILDPNSSTVRLIPASWVKADHLLY